MWSRRSMTHIERMNILALASLLMRLLDNAVIQEPEQGGVSLKESAVVDVRKRQIASPKVKPEDAEKRRAERILSVMAQGKATRLSEISKLSEIPEDDALQTLHALKATGRVIPFDPDEELPGTFWIRC
jgi:hypothetical protein